MKRRNVRLSASVAVALSVLVISAACGSDSGTSPAATTPSESPTAAEPLQLVAIGDSIPYNAPEDCPGCTGFVDLYADELAEATGREVETQNLSQHNSLTLPMLLDELDTYEDELSTADAIIVGVAHNSIALNGDAPCGTTWNDATSTFEDWSKLTEKCAVDSAAEYRDSYDELFSTVAGWRADKPTILLALNKYSDWIGWSAASAEELQLTIPFHDAWNTMLCDSAVANGFTCADLYQAFNGPDGAEPAGDLLAADHTHPSAEGNEAIADVLVTAGFAPLG